MKLYKNEFQYPEILNITRTALFRKSLLLGTDVLNSVPGLCSEISTTKVLLPSTVHYQYCMAVPLPWDYSCQQGALTSVM